MEQETVLHIEGTVEQVLYRNEQNGYTVLDLDANGTLITVVGELGDVEEGEQLSVDGTYVNHIRFGVQFQAQYVERKLPEDAINIQRYLSSGVIKGIGSALAKKIVTAFGSQTLEIMEKQPTRLMEIRGISPKMFHIGNGCGLGNTVEFLLIAVSVLPAATKKSLRFAGKLATVNPKTNDSTLLSSLDATPVQKATHNRMPDASGCVAFASCRCRFPQLVPELQAETQYRTVWNIFGIPENFNRMSFSIEK